MTKPNNDISVERLREVLRYDQETGVFTWLITLSARAVMGDVAGSQKPSGYITIDVDGKRYRAHRLAWLYMIGEHPPRMVDHRDNVRNHNWWSNLRLANNQQNGGNSKRKVFNTSGYKGVFWCKQKQKWCAKINPNRRQVHLGFFDIKEEAARAYAEASKVYFGEFARDDAPAQIINIDQFRRVLRWNAAVSQYRPAA